MSRSVRISFLVVAVAATIGVAFLLFYKTSVPATVPSVPQEQDGAFGGVSLRIEYATTSESRERGLGGRERIAPDEAMLFVFPEDDLYGFWMSDMLMPIDIFWLDSKGQVVSIAQNVATSTYPNVFYPDVPARYVLETIAGFAAAHTIVIGTPLQLKIFPDVFK